MPGMSRIGAVSWRKMSMIFFIRGAELWNVKVRKVSRR
jgi:hypothetical protein